MIELIIEFVTEYQMEVGLIAYLLITALMNKYEHLFFREVGDQNE